ncbi:MAG: tRNA(Met) cytidine acetyltransferase [bacterium]|nr:tRNA(Met) cytidine acetyltransferase [bacterium]
MKPELKAVVEQLKEEATKSYQRRMVVLTGDTDKKLALAAEVANEFFLEYPQVKLLYLTDSVAENTLSQRRFQQFKDQLEKKFSVKLVEYGRTKKILGTTFDCLVLDATHDLRADDLGRAVETVRGSGLILLLAPAFRVWRRAWLLVHRTFITPPYTLKDVRHNFIPRIIRKLEEHPGIVIIDADKEKVLKPVNWTTQEFREEQEITANIPSTLAEICKTQDQATCIEKLANFYISQKKAFILIADRGRGKTASLGLAAAYLIYLGKIKKRIIVTSPEAENVQPFFEFLEKGLKALGIEFSREGKKVKAKGIEVLYRKPLQVLDAPRPDLLIVDEAAAFPTTLLFKYFDRFDKIVYSSTIHGYEGAGRGFSVRFLGRLRKAQLEQLEEYKMETPIRYAPGDYIERWLYDALLLDAEPEKLEQEDLRAIEQGQLVFEHPDLREWFERNDKDLRAYFGIYILAHYRNSPMDLQLLADAPHHDAFVTRTSTGKIVNAIQVAYEGGLDKETAKKITRGFDPSGNLIPCKVGQNYQDEVFPTLRGMRIVRIATHPDVQGKGIGSAALRFLEDWARKRGYDWLGSGFGATPELVRFWAKNGFYPVHISPLRQASSGEYSVVVLKPLTEKVKKAVQDYNYAFKLKLLGSLLDAHRNLEPEIALALLEVSAYDKQYFERRAPRFLLVELQGIRAFLHGATCYESVYGLLRKLACTYFLDPDRPLLDELDKKIMVVKLLQNKKWKEVKREIGVSRRTVIKRIREITELLLKKYEYLLR